MAVRVDASGGVASDVSSSGIWSTASSLRRRLRRFVSRMPKAWSASSERSAS